MPFKVFTNGVPLPASDLNDYLMEQSIATFADSAARAAQLVSPTEGQLTYLADTDLHQFWNGSNWVTFGASLTLLSTTTLSGASVTLSSIPQNYTDLRLVVREFRPSVDATLWLRVNGLSTLIYASGNTIPTGNAQWSIPGTDQDNGAGSLFLSQTDIYNYSNSTTWKFGRTIGVMNNITTPTTQNFRSNDLNLQLTSAITSLTLLPSTGTFTSGTALLYGVR